MVGKLFEILKKTLFEKHFFQKKEKNAFFQKTKKQSSCLSV